MTLLKTGLLDLIESCLIGVQINILIIRSSLILVTLCPSQEMFRKVLQKAFPKVFQDA